MEFNSCRKGGGEHSRLLESIPTKGSILFHSPSSHSRARSLALLLAQAAAALCKIKTAPKGERHKETANLCQRFAKILLVMNGKLDKMDCRREEKEVFETMEKEAAGVFRWLAERRGEGLRREDFAEQEGRLVYIAMLCNAMGNESFAAVKKSNGFLELCGESPEGLWWLTVRTSICAARERVVELIGEEKTMNREKEVQAFLCEIVDVLQDLVRGVMSMEQLVEGMGGATTPARPDIIDEIVLFAEHVMGTVALLNNDWRAVAPWELDQRRYLEDWIREEFENLTLLALSVPSIGSWYIS